MIDGRVALRDLTTKELEPDAMAFNSGRFGNSSFLGGVGRGLSSGFFGSGMIGGCTGFSFGLGGSSVNGLVYLAIHLTGSIETTVAGSTGSFADAVGKATSRTKSTVSFGTFTSFGGSIGRGMSSIL